MPSVLIVDDLPAVHEMLEAVIAPSGFDVTFALSGEQALRKYREQAHDVVLADISMQGMDGITLLRELKALDTDATVILMTGYSSAETAMQAIKFGAFDYVQKPFRIDELVKTLRRASESRQKTAAPRPGRVERGPDAAAVSQLADALAGDSKLIEGVRNGLLKLIPGRTPVLILGEQGTGRKQVAEALHKGGPHAAGPFRVYDCKLADPFDLHDQLVRKDGSIGPLFEGVDGGTLFLMNVDELTIDSQEVLAAALSLLEGRFRLVCSSAVNLEQRVDEGRFSDQFYFKISTLPVLLPPLRERREDIPALIDDVMGKAVNPFFPSSKIEFSAEAEDIFQTYPWPGNVTELSNVVATMVAIAMGRVIGPEMLPRRMKEITYWPKLNDYLAEREKAYLKLVLRACGNDRRRAATAAGVPEGRFDRLS